MIAVSIWNPDDLFKILNTAFQLFTPWMLSREYRQVGFKSWCANVRRSSGNIEVVNVAYIPLLSGLAVVNTSAYLLLIRTFC